MLPLAYNMRKNGMMVTREVRGRLEWVYLVCTTESENIFIKNKKLFRSLNVVEICDQIHYNHWYIIETQMTFNQLKTKHVLNLHVLNLEGRVRGKKKKEIGKSWGWDDDWWWWSHMKARKGTAKGRKVGGRP
jgi:hypothetical protein